MSPNLLLRRQPAKIEQHGSSYLWRWAASATEIRNQTSWVYFITMQDRLKLALIPCGECGYGAPRYPRYDSGWFTLESRAAQQGDAPENVTLKNQSRAPSLRSVRRDLSFSTSRSRWSLTLGGTIKNNCPRDLRTSFPFAFRLNH